MYVSSEIATRIKSLAEAKEIELQDLFKEAGTGKNTMANMQKSMPSCDKLARIADILGCSVDYLLGRTEYIVPSESPILSDQDLWIISKFRELDTDGVIAVKGVLLSEYRRATAEKGSELEAV